MSESMTTNPDLNWALVHEWGDDCKTHVDVSSINKNDACVLAMVNYLLNPPSRDTSDDRAIEEMRMLEEYNLQSEEFRVLEITFHYADGSTKHLTTREEWVPAIAGNLLTLAFLRQAVEEDLTG